MRGKVSVGRLEIISIRITPAYAGKSADLRIHAKRKEDHPRLCGEKCRIFGQKRLPLGSPPPMRGKDAPLVVWIGQLGITPAYAGKSAFCGSLILLL